LGEDVSSSPRVKLTQVERISYVRDMFGWLALHYDLFNHVASLGRDRFWRQATARRVKVFKTGRILDVAAGTGDQCLANVRAHPGSTVFGVDFVYPMLKVGQNKFRSLNMNTCLFPVASDALCLPFPNESFDCATMSFGIRNIPDHLAAMKEIYRVLVPGGRALILEMTFPRWSFIRRFYNIYLNRLIPVLGNIISGNPKPFHYLADSIMDFPLPQSFCRIMQKAGFKRTRFYKMTIGITVLHLGEK